MDALGDCRGSVTRGLRRHAERDLDDWIGHHLHGLAVTCFQPSSSSSSQSSSRPSRRSFQVQPDRAAGGGLLCDPRARRAIVGAEQSGHLDTILALPISRRVLLVGSYPVAALVALAIMAVVGLLTFIAGRLAGTGISASLVTAGVIRVWPLALFFGGVSAVASTSAEQRLPRR